ncbi:hypothetical protein D3C80_1846080 [compost metagenome]
MARLDLGEGQHLGGMAQRIARDLVRRAQRIGNGGLIGGGRDGVLRQRRRAGQQKGGDGGGEQMRLH